MNLNSNSNGNHFVFSNNRRSLRSSNIMRESIPPPRNGIGATSIAMVGTEPNVPPPSLTHFITSTEGLQSFLQEDHDLQEYQELLSHFRVQQLDSNRSTLPVVNTTNVVSENVDENISGATTTSHGGWMPIPAKLHTGDTNMCSNCSEMLMCSSGNGWNGYLQSEAFLDRVFDSILDDKFVSSLICGDTYCGDLPVEYRLHLDQDKLQKLQKKVVDFQKVTSAGILDGPGKRQTLNRQLEQIWSDGMPASLYALTMEKRLAVILHVSKTLTLKNVLPNGLLQNENNIGNKNEKTMPFHQLAINTLSVLLDTYDFQDTHNSSHPIVEFTNLLQQFPILSLWEYWNALPNIEESKVELNGKDITADEKGKSCGDDRPHMVENAVDGTMTTFWSPLISSIPTVCTINVREADALTGVEIHWHHLMTRPDIVEVYCKRKQDQKYVRVAKKRLNTMGTSASVDRVSVATNGIPLLGIEQLKLSMYNINRIDSKKATTTSIRHICLFQAKNCIPRTSAMSLESVENWLYKAAASEVFDQPTRTTAILALRSWMLATGYLPSMLRFVYFFLTTQQKSDAMQNEAHLAFSTLDSYVTDEIQKAELAGSKPSLATVTTVIATFDERLSSSGVVIDAGGYNIRTREASYQHAVVGYGISKGCAAWTFRLDHDTPDDEMTCFGAATIPITISSYDSSPDLWMVRAYNGNVYARGKKLNKIIGKVHPGDSVTIEVDMEAGTMSYKVNDYNFGVIFSNLKGYTIYPAISSYGTGKRVSLVKLDAWGNTLKSPSAGINLEEKPLYLSRVLNFENKQVVPAIVKLDAEENIEHLENDDVQVATSLLHQVSDDSTAGLTFSVPKNYVLLRGSCSVAPKTSKIENVTFRICANKKILWESKQTSRKPTCFSVSVENQESIEMHAFRDEGQGDFTAIWIDPYMLVNARWTCKNCNYGNSLEDSTCSCCAHPNRTVNESFDTKKIQSCHKQQTLCIEEKILKHVATLATKYVDSTIDGETYSKPFSLNPTAATFESLLKLLLFAFHTKDAKSESILKSVLEIIAMNCIMLRKIGMATGKGYHVITEDSSWNPAVLLEHVENLAGIGNTTSLTPTAGADRVYSYSNETKMAAARCITSGFGLFYPTASSRVNLVLMLVHDNNRNNFHPKSAQYFILCDTLMQLSKPGDHGVLSFFRTSKCVEQFQSSAEANENSHVDSLMVLLADIIASDTHRNELILAGKELLCQYQRNLLAEAIETATDSIQGTECGANASAPVNNIQMALARHTCMLLTKSRISLEISLISLQQAAAAQKTEKVNVIVDALQCGLVGQCLPWFLNNLCLLRRQSWLAAAVLPALVRLLQLMDAFAAMLDPVLRSESRFLRYEAQKIKQYLGSGSSEISLRNVFTAMYTGEKDHFDGQIGFHFEAVNSFSILALGRSVNMSVHNGVLKKAHAIRLWDDATESLLAEISVDSTSQKDDLGYVFERLPTAISILKGRQYRVTSYEYPQSGDPWYKKENHPDEKYEENFIKILQDCYAAGSVAFPGNQNLLSAAYGVPTFYMEKKVTTFIPQDPVPSFGTESLLFDAKRTTKSLRIHDEGRSVESKRDTNGWATAYVIGQYVAGCHKIDIMLGQEGNSTDFSGFFSVGVAAHRSCDSFIGNETGSIGWLPHGGQIWHNGISYDTHSKGSPVKRHDTISLIIDFDSKKLEFYRNGIRQGVFGLAEDIFASGLYVAVSLFTPGDIATICPGGLLGMTFHPHWLLDTMKSAASCAGRLCGTMVVGSAIDGLEEEQLPWLQSNLFRGGVFNQSVPAGGKVKTWFELLKIDYKENPGTIPMCLPSSEFHTSSVDSGVASCEIPWLSRIDGISKLGTIISLLQESHPDKSVLRKSGSFPDCEMPFFASLLLRGSQNVQDEAAALVREERVDAMSLEMLDIWKVILALRHYLIKCKHEYRFRETSKAVPNEPSKSEKGRARRVSVASTFVEYLQNVRQRATFLCSIQSYADEDNEQDGMNTKQTLESIAQSIGDENPPTALEPPGERWKALSFSDRSKWSGVVSVLRAQHEWRTKLRKEVLDDSEPVFPEGELSMKAALIKACELYVRNGGGAPPEILESLLVRRKERSKSRIFGLHAFSALAQVLSVHSPLHDVLLFLRPSFRGFTEAEMESRESKSMEPTENLPNDTAAVYAAASSRSFRTIARHHPLNGLEGCSKIRIHEVQDAFQELYMKLYEKINECISMPSLQLGRTILRSWSLDFEHQDHEFILRVGLVPALHSLFSLQQRLSRANSLLGNSGASDIIVQSWKPYSLDFVKMGLLNGSTLTMREVFQNVKSCPHYQLLKRRGLLARASGEIELCTEQHSVSSTILLYSEFLVALSKLNASTSTQRTYIETPALAFNVDSVTDEGCAAVQLNHELESFTLETWINITKTNACATIFSNVELENGAVRIELLPKGIRFSVAGNTPESVCLPAVFHEREWYHIGICYGNSMVRLFVNGIALIESEFKFKNTVNAVQFKDIAIGSMPATDGLSSNTHPFSGMMSEMRLWDCCQLKHHFELNYQRRISRSALHLIGLWRMDGKNIGKSSFAIDSHISDNPYHATLSNCNWVNKLIPIFDTEIRAIQKNWFCIIHLIMRFQRLTRAKIKKRKRDSIKIIKEKMDLDDKAVAVTLYHTDDMQDEEEDVVRPLMPSSSSSRLSGFVDSVSLANLGSNSTKLEKWDAVDDFSRFTLGNCAWLLFKHIGTVVTCGTHERRDFEAKSSAAAAKLKRKSKTESKLKAEESSLKPAKSDTVAGHSSKKEYDLQTLWFSMELHRKVFEVFESELVCCVLMLQESEGLTRSQRPPMSRSISTPAKTSYDNMLQQKNPLMEPLEIDSYLYRQVLYVYSQSNTRPFELFVTRPVVLQNYVLLLRYGSPRLQRIILLILRSVIKTVTPNDIESILGSSTALIDLLLDRASESIFGAASPTSKITAQHIRYSRQGSSAEGATECLTSPQGYGSGAIHLILGSESISFLRMLLLDPKWTSKVNDVIFQSINAAPSMLLEACNALCSGNSKSFENIEVRFRAVTLRTLGSLCVLGAHTDCIRVGGKVQVAQHASGMKARSLVDEQFSSRGSVAAWLVEINHELPTAKVVFEGSFDDSDPVHNIQTVPLASLTPKQEVVAPLTQITISEQLIEAISQLSVVSLEGARSSSNPSAMNLLISQVKTRALLALQAIFRGMIGGRRRDKNPNIFSNYKTKTAGLYIHPELLEAALSPINLPSFVALPYLEERARLMLCRLIEASTPLGNEMLRQMSSQNNTDSSSSVELNETCVDLPAHGAENNAERQQCAASLAMMGFDLDLCMHALKQNRDNMNAAADWLMSDAASQYRSEIRQASNKIAPPKSTTYNTRLQQAADLEAICSIPRQLIALVLELFHDDPDQTMGWLMDNGTDYILRLESLTDKFQQTSDTSVQSVASFDDLTFTEPLLAVWDCSLTTKNIECDDIHGVAEVTVCPVTQDVNNLGKCSENLLRHAILTVSDVVGPIHRLAASGQTGLVVSASEDSIVLRFINSETGLCYEESFLPSQLRQISEFFGVPIKNVSSLFRVALDAEAALTTQYARKAIVALMAAFDSDSALAINIPRAFGGPVELCKFLKLVAASERVVSSHKEIPDFKKHHSMNSLTSDDDFELMPVLRKKLIQIIMEERNVILGVDKLNAHLDTLKSHYIAPKELKERDSLLSVLIKEAINQLDDTINIRSRNDKPVNGLIMQSLHPYFSPCNYTSVVEIDQASGLQIVFDERSNLGPNAVLTFFADSKMTTKIAEFDGKAFSDLKIKNRPILINENRFWYNFKSEKSTAGTSNYGFKFQVSEVQRYEWQNEKQVLADPSLEWSCWILNFLLEDAKDHIPDGFVHNSIVYNALVRYLLSAGAPQKNMIVSILSQLLSSSEKFPLHETPKLTSLSEVCEIVIMKAEAEQTSGNLVFPTRLLELVELTMIVHASKKHFDEIGSLDAKPTPRALDDSNRDIRDVLGETKNLMLYFAQKHQLASTMKESILSNIWSNCKVVETSHTCDPDEHLEGKIEFVNCSMMKVWFDYRSRIENSSLRIRGDIPLTNEVAKTIKGQSGCPLEAITQDQTFTSVDGNVLKLPGSCIIIPGNVLHYDFRANGPTTNNFGVAFSVVAFHSELVCLSRVASLEDCISVDKINATWSAGMDTQLVEWVNAEAERSGNHSTAISPWHLRLQPELQTLKCNLLMEVSLSNLQLRFGILRQFNQNLMQCLELFDLRNTKAKWTNAWLLRKLGHCIFYDVKTRIIEAAIEKTWVSSDVGGNARIVLDRIKALESAEDAKIEPSVSQCFFAQAFHQLNRVDSRVFRKKIDNKGRLFSVKFRGEEGVDWGGVYRDGANLMVDSLFSSNFNLFVLCPNGQHNIGANRGMYIPNPLCTSPVAIQMFEFAGILLGISLRTKGDFPFALPSLVWKQFISQALDRTDLEATDAMVIQMLNGIRDCQNDGISNEEEFQQAFADLELTFTTTGCIGNEVELAINGKLRKVTYNNRVEYCDMVEAYRLNEGQQQIAAMRYGLSTVVPIHTLQLLTYQEMELLACGSPRIDIDVWKSHTKYDGYAEDDPTVLLFWKVLSSFSDEQRADFVRFAWGRSRLPRGRWPQPFKLTKKSGRDSTKYLPVAHTCFFSVELPPYTTEEVMRSMLTATITFGLSGILMA